MTPNSQRRTKTKQVILKLCVIRTDAGTQSRAGVDEHVAADYAEAMLGGAVTRLSPRLASQPDLLVKRKQS